MSLTLSEDNKMYGAKADKGKARAGLIFQDFPRALQAISEVATFGANKYSAHSWQGVPNARERYEDAMMRHWLSLQTGEVLDPESGLPHFAHFAWGALAVLEMEKRGQDGQSEEKSAKPI